jgi:hypothetical protein
MLWNAPILTLSYPTFQYLPSWLSSLFVYLRPVVMIIVTVFTFAATSHFNNILLRTIEQYERITQIFILCACATFYTLSVWMLFSCFTLPLSNALLWLAALLLVLLVVAHGM